MCSVGDDNFDEVETSKYMIPKQNNSHSSKCNKCREASPIILLRSKDQYCKDCFLMGTVHKFKALLGKYKLIRPNDKILVIYKISHPTTALLHFIRTGLDLETHKKLRFQVVVVFIEENYHLSLIERRNIAERVEKQVGSFNFPIYFTSLARIITNDFCNANLKSKSTDLQLSENDSKIIADFLKKQSNITSSYDFLNILKQKYYRKIGIQLNCKFIFTPETSTDISSQILTDISLGRGSQVALNTGFCDSRNDEIKILRPLRVFDLKELAFYNYLNNLEPVSVTPPVNNPYQSIQSLVKKFVQDLQSNYPATVTTILKTGDKLKILDKSTKICDFCKARIEEENGELNSAESTQFSHWVSTQSCNSSVFQETLDAFANIHCDNYCYSCKKFVK